MVKMNMYTVFENHIKKSHSTLRAKRATFTFSVDNSSLKMPKNGQFCDGTKQKLVEILGDFQTL